MTHTIRIPAEQLPAYLDRFTRRFLNDMLPRSVDIELVGVDWGDQRVVECGRLVAIGYDSRADALEVMFTTGEHRVPTPRAVWTIEEGDGFLRTMFVRRADGSDEIIHVRRVGLALRPESVR